MKIERLFIYCLLAGTSLLASCCSEELTDNQAETLPEGMYPLEISSIQVAHEPQTRVAEIADGSSSEWEWNGNEKIGVQLYSDGDNATYTLKTDKTLSPDDKTLYWRNTSSTTVNAWYPATNGTLDLSNQSNGLVYAMKGTGSGDYRNGVALSFSHSLAKVRVKVEKGTYTGALNVTAVSVKGYTSCTVTNGAVSSPSGSLSAIQMKKNGDYWEANLVRGEGALGNAITINADGKTTTCTLASAVTLMAAQMHTCTVTVNAAGPTKIEPGKDGNYTINAGDNVYIEGTATGTITINGTADVELRNVTSDTDTPIKITNGTPVIKVTGSNTFTTKNGTPGIHLYGSNANVEITGDGAGKSSLTITVPNNTDNNDGSPAIGSYGRSCGNIKISNITLTASGNKNRGGDYSAAIGIGSAGSGSPNCGNIIIENCVIKASAQDNAAAIGFGANYYGGEIKSITITNSQLELNVTGVGAGIGFGAIWNPNNLQYVQSLGPVTITSNEDESTFFSRFKVQDYKVGKLSENRSNQTWQGVTFNGKSLADGNSNGYK